MLYTWSYTHPGCVQTHFKFFVIIPFLGFRDIWYFKHAFSKYVCYCLSIKRYNIWFRVLLQNRPETTGISAKSCLTATLVQIFLIFCGVRTFLLLSPLYTIPLLMHLKVSPKSDIVYQNELTNFKNMAWFFMQSAISIIFTK